MAALCCLRSADQWDHQAEVKRVHDMLTKLGVKVWMDISGG
eukprot:COSAG06_NODE_56955_length_282_cov_0.868852_1_plen_40_part_10